MTSFVINTATTTAKTLTAGEAGLVTAQGSILTTGTAAISVNGGGTVAVAGAVLANGNVDAVNFYNAGNTQLTVSETGLVSGLHGVSMAGATGIASLNNDGMISGQSTGVSMLGSEGKIVNTGHIAGFGSTGLYAGVTGDLYLSNSGSIDGSVYGMYRYNAGDTNIVNTGTIAGSSQSVHLDAGDDLVTNAGALMGEVVLGSGDDTFRGQQGLQGAVFGQGGQDTLFGGRYDDLLDGGAGNDRMKGLGDDDNLAGGDGNDVVYGGSGDDSLTGSTGNDQLYGNDGDDLISGGGGTDRLLGGHGNDTLAGDGGADVFIFATGGGDDLIQGFADNIDVMDLRFLGVASLAELKSHATDGSLGLRLDLHDFDSGSIIVQGLTVATLTAQDVLL